MSDDLSTALQQELASALVVLEPQIRGLDDLTKLSLSEDLAGRVRSELAARVHRGDLINAAIAALVALDGDGYPELVKLDLPSPEFDELQTDLADLMAAVGEFEAAPRASTITVNLGAPMPKVE